MGTGKRLDFPVPSFVKRSDCEALPVSLRKISSSFPIRFVFPIFSFRFVLARVVAFLERCRNRDVDPIADANFD